MKHYHPKVYGDSLNDMYSKCEDTMTDNEKTDETINILAEAIRCLEGAQEMLAGPGNPDLRERIDYSLRDCRALLEEWEE